jgi:hypothetical protein
MIKNRFKRQRLPQPKKVHKAKSGEGQSISC